MFQTSFIFAQNGLIYASCLPQQCLKIGVKPGDPGMKPGSNRNETGQHPEWARCDRSGSAKLGSELARSSSEFSGATRSSSDGPYTGTTQSLHGHYVVTTRSLRSFLFKGPLGATPAEQTKAACRKNMAEAGLTSPSRPENIRERAFSRKQRELFRRGRSWAMFACVFCCELFCFGNGFKCCPAPAVLQLLSRTCRCFWLICE